MTKLPVPLTVPPVTLSPSALFHRERFAGDHRLFHAGMTFDDFAIHGHFVAGHDSQPVADSHLIERNFMVATVGDLSRGGRSKVEQRFDRAARATAGSKFEHLAQ